MTTLVVGASGATGRLLVEQLLERGEHVRVIVRSRESLPNEIASHDNLSVIQASVLDLPDDEMIRHVGGCNAVASCLGHTLNFKGYVLPSAKTGYGCRKKTLQLRQSEPACGSSQVRAYEYYGKQKS